jgi:hypothetical protein
MIIGRSESNKANHESESPMAANATKKRNPTDTPPVEDSSSSGAWRPEVEMDREFNPFANTTVPGEERSQISDSAPEPAPVVQPSEATATRRTNRKRRSGGKAQRSVRRARGSKRKATRSGARTKAKVKVKTRAKAKAKAGVRARGKGRAAVRRRAAKTGPRRTRRRSARRR